MELGVLADDLTGAADVVAPFASRFRTGVGIGLNSVYSGGLWDVWAWNTETRGVDNKTLVQDRIRQATDKLLHLEPKLLYKKIDSTLRGNLEWELRAMCTCVPKRIPLVCPAFPAMGRTVREGKLYVHGTCWTDTEFAPATGCGTVADAFGGTFSNAVFADAESEEELLALAQRVLKNPKRWLVVGSSGLSRAIARSFEIERNASITSFSGRILVVVGSQHPRSREQADHYCQTREVPRFWVDDTTNRSEIVSQIRDLWGKGATEIVLETSNEHLSISPNDALRRILAPLFHEACSFEVIFATGGDTAIQIAEVLGATYLRVLGEKEPGVVVSLLKYSSSHSLTLITKAGGFGNRETIAHCFQSEVSE